MYTEEIRIAPAVSISYKKKLLESLKLKKSAKISLGTKSNIAAANQG